MACCLQSSISTSAASLRPPLLKVSDSPRPRSPPGLGPFILVGTDVDLLQRERAAASSAARAPLARLQTTMKNRRLTGEGQSPVHRHPLALSPVNQPFSINCGCS